MSEAIDAAGFAGLALIGYSFGGVLGAGIVLTLSSLATALIVARGRG